MRDVVVAIAAASATGCAALALYLYANKPFILRPNVPKAGFGLAAAAPPATARVPNFSDDEVLAEQWTRNEQFFGLDGQLCIARSFVVVIGLGVRDKRGAP